MTRPRLLDLYCGAGGAARGYHDAGFDIIGVDIEPQPNYPYPFVQGDALAFLERGGGPIGFDAIHASPPCQAYTTMNNRHASTSPPLIAPTRLLLEATGLPYVIENVEGARADLHYPIRMHGAQFGLGVHRPRLFECSFPLLAPSPAPRQKDAAAVYGKEDGRRLFNRKDGTILYAARLPEASVAMGIDWMTWDEIREAIPPAYTEYIGRALLDQLRAARAAVPDSEGHQQ